MLAQGRPSRCPSPWSSSRAGPTGLEETQRLLMPLPPAAQACREEETAPRRGAHPPHPPPTISAPAPGAPGLRSGRPGAAGLPGNSVVARGDAHAHAPWVRNPGGEAWVPSGCHGTGWGGPPTLRPGGAGLDPPAQSEAGEQRGVPPRPARPHRRMKLTSKTRLLPLSYPLASGGPRRTERTERDVLMGDGSFPHRELRPAWFGNLAACRTGI